MPIQLNTKEFYWIKKALDAARDSISRGWYQSALLELRKPAKRLAEQPLPNRLQALVLLTQAQAYRGLNSTTKELKSLKATQEIFTGIEDSDSNESIACSDRIREIETILTSQKRL
ncbi:hypothetical protein [Ileibacterium valens]|uniref:hypothetical protein n=1 Tax=Ileibacterium valens TaxID=1862668 RepID=UPI0023527879|nr:hypothetical protein [Ileibacterium valens]